MAHVVVFREAKGDSFLMFAVRGVSMPITTLGALKYVSDNGGFFIEILHFSEPHNTEHYGCLGLGIRRIRVLLHGGIIKGLPSTCAGEGY